MPEVEAVHLLEILRALGWCQSNGFGAAPISFAELAAWSGLNQYTLEPWEVHCIRSASIAYCAQSSAKDDSREPNFDGAADAGEKPMSAIRAMALALNKAKPEPPPEKPNANNTATP